MIPLKKNVIPLQLKDKYLTFKDQNDELKKTETLQLSYRELG